MNTSTSFEQRLGQAYVPARSLSLKLGGQSESPTQWVVFAASPSNPQILRLAPAFGQKKTQDSMPIAKEGSPSQLWLVPGVEIDVHAKDLEQWPSDGQYRLQEVSPETATLTPDVLEKEAAFLAQIEQVAYAIEEQLHTADAADSVLPLLADCVLEAENVDCKSLTFVWSPDRQRAYQLQHTGMRWLLTQEYRDVLAVATDKEMPLETPKEVLSFNAVGEAILSKKQAREIYKTFGKQAPDTLTDQLIAFIQTQISAAQSAGKFLEDTFPPVGVRGQAQEMALTRGRGQDPQEASGQTDKKKEGWIKSCTLPAIDWDDGINLEWNLPKELIDLISGWSVEVWMVSVDAPKRQVRARFGKLDDAVLDPGIVYVETSDLAGISVRQIQDDPRVTVRILDTGACHVRLELTVVG